MLFRAFFQIFGVREEMKRQQNNESEAMLWRLCTLPCSLFVSAPKVDSGPVLGLDLDSLHCVQAILDHVHAGFLFPYQRTQM